MPLHLINFEVPAAPIALDLAIVTHVTGGFVLLQVVMEASLQQPLEEVLIRGE